MGSISGQAYYMYMQNVTQCMNLENHVLELDFLISLSD